MGRVHGGAADYRSQLVATGGYTITVKRPTGYLPTMPGPVPVVEPAFGDVVVPPMRLAGAPWRRYLPYLRFPWTPPSAAAPSVRGLGLPDARWTNYR